MYLDLYLRFIVYELDLIPKIYKMKKINISLERIDIFLFTKTATIKVFTKLKTFKKAAFTNSHNFLSSHSFLTPFWFSPSPPFSVSF